MKKYILLLACTAFFTIANAQTMKTVKLNKPSADRGASIMKSLSDRHSARAYADKDLSIQDLSDLLWAANGFNREEGRTNATAMNCQEIDLYVCMKDGAYLYEAKEQRLRQVTDKDLRPAVANGQDFVKKAPVCLIIVADMARTRGDNEASRAFTAYDAGIVSSNIYLFCSGCGLATVCRGTMDKTKLAEGLKLSDKQIIHLNHPVGYAE